MKIISALTLIAGLSSILTLSGCIVVPVHDHGGYYRDHGYDRAYPRGGYYYR